MSDLILATATVNNWTKTTTAPKLRVYYKETFTSSDGTIVERGSPDGGVAWDEITTTLNSGDVVIPAVTLKTTLDGIDKRTSTVSFWWYDGNTKIGLFGEYGDLIVPTTLTDLTFAGLKIYNNGSPRLPQDGYYTRREMDRLLTLFIGSAVTLDDVQTLTNKTLTSPIINLGSDATGDVYYRNAGGAFARLGVGSNAQVLTISAGLPSWQTPTPGFSDPMSTRGDLIYKNSAGTTTRLAVGAANRYLSSDGLDAAWGQVSLSAGVTGTLPVANGGTGSATQNFVDLTTAQASIAGAKTFTGVMTHIAAPAVDGAQSSSVASNIFRGADSSSGSPINNSVSAEPSTYLQTFRTGGTNGVGIFGFLQNFNLIGAAAGNTYGSYIISRISPSMTGAPPGSYFHEVTRSYLRLGATDITPGDHNVIGYAYTANAERTVSGVRVVAGYFELRNSTVSDANVSFGSIDSTANIVTSNDGTSHNTHIIYSEGPSNATSAYGGWRVAANAVAQRVLDFTDASFTLQGTWTASAATTIAGVGGHADVECVPGDILSVNGTNVTVLSAIANTITLTATFGGTPASGLTITKKVQPAWFANNSYLWWNNAAASAKYRAIGLGTGDVWSLDPDGRNVTFGTSIIANNNATNKVRIGASADTTYPGIWFGDGAASPSLSNYSFLYDESVDTTILNAPLVIDFRIANAAAWTINSSKHLIVTATDNTLDIGASGASRPRTAYLGTSLITPVGTFATSISTPSIITASGALTVTPASNANVILATTGMIGIGGSTSSFPGLIRNGNSLYIRLADDSAYAGVAANFIDLKSGGNRLITVSAFPSFEELSLASGVQLKWTNSATAAGGGDSGIARVGAASLKITDGSTGRGDLEVLDEAYGAGWNGSFEVPTKNALFDKIELLAPLVSPSFTTPNIGAATGTSLSLSSDITLTGTGRRFLADMSNATISNRFGFQTSTPSGSTVMSIIAGSPSGTASAVRAFGGPDPDNTHFGGLLVNTGGLNIESSKNGSGSYLPISFNTSGVVGQMQIDTLGNVILGFQAALATSATNGFMYIPVMAGTPTGDSTDFTGKVPMVWDSSGNKLWVNTGGTTWKGVVLA